MPNLFLSGVTKFTASGTKEQIDDVMSDVEIGWSCIAIDYEEDEITKTIEFRLKDKVSGSFEFIRKSDEVLEVVLEGVVKTSAQAGAVSALTDAGTPWIVASVSGGSRSVSVGHTTDRSSLKLTKKAPKT